MTTARVTRIIAAIDSLNDVDMRDFLNLYELRDDEPDAVFAPTAPEPPKQTEEKKGEFKPYKTKAQSKDDAVDLTPDMSGDTQSGPKDSHPY